MAKARHPLQQSCIDCPDFCVDFCEPGRVVGDGFGRRVDRVLLVVVGEGFV